MKQDLKNELQLFCQEKEPFVFSMLVEEVQEGKQMRIELVPFNEKYVLSFKISQQALAVHPVLSNYYETLEQLYEDIEQKFQDVAISGSGLIFYELLVGGKRRRRIELQAQKSFVRSILSKRQPWQKTKQIPVHVVSAVGFDSEREAFLKRLVNFDEKYSELQETVKKQNEIIDKLKNQVEYLKEKVDKGDLKMMAMELKAEQNEKKIEFCELQLAKMQTQQVYLKEYIQANQLYCSISQLKPQSRHLLNNDIFKVILNPDGPRIKKISNDNQWQNFILNGPLEENKITSIKIQVFKSANSQINLGICTEEIFDQLNTIKSSGHISFDFKKGLILSMGQIEYATGSKVQKGEYVTMTVDLLHWRLSWVKQSADTQQQHLGDLMLPEEFQFTDLYIVITILKSGQGVKLIVE